MAVLVKSGVVFKKFLKEIIRVIVVLDGISDEIGVDMVITSANDGVHSKNSLHYKDRALDIRTFHLNEEQKKVVLELLKSRLGGDYDVIFETNPEHIHIEYDPKQKPS